MNDVLSQAEIDKLLKALTTGNSDEIEDGNGNADEQKDGVRRYDFKTANRFTKEQIRAINVIFKNFAQLLSNYLMGLLRADSDAEVISIEEMSFNEFNNSVPSPSIIAVINSTPFPGSILLEMSKEVAFAIINRVLGGKKEVESEGRQFTEIELAIAERVLWQILKIMDEAWSKMMDVRSSLEKIETSMQFVQIVDINEAVLTVTVNVTIGEESGTLGFCLSHQAIEPFMKMLNTRIVFPGKNGNKAAAQPSKQMNSLIGTSVEVSCDFNTTEAAVKDILNLREGDVIQLRHKVDEPLIIRCQQVPKFCASLGTYKNHMAAKILDIVKGDEEIE